MINGLIARLYTFTGGIAVKGNESDSTIASLGIGGVRKENGGASTPIPSLYPGNSQRAVPFVYGAQLGAIYNGSLGIFMIYCRDTICPPDCVSTGVEM
jgi:hypothetical protein